MIYDGKSSQENQECTIENILLTLYAHEIIEIIKILLTWRNNDKTDLK